MTRADRSMLCILGAVLGLYGWAVFVTTFHHDGLIGPQYNTPGVDYMVYYRAARDWLEGTPALIGDPMALTAQINHDFAAWLRGPVPLHPWVYPPPFLLLMLPFALLPFALSYALFQATSFTAMLAGAWLWTRSTNERSTGDQKLWLIALALAPATSVNVVAGQNAFLTLALLLGGFGVRERSRLTGGAILGLLCYKPQFALLVPVALVALRDWRAIAAAMTSGACAALMSAAVLGVGPWRDWFGFMTGQQDAAFAAWLDAGRAWGFSAWACAIALGATPRLASFAQAAAVLLAAACVYRTFRVTGGGTRPMALLLVATLLAAPHSSPYDLLLLNGAALLMFTGMLAGTGPTYRPSMLILLWATPVLGVPHNGAAGFIAPMVMLGCLVLLVRRWRVLVGAPGWQAAAR